MPIASGMKQVFNTSVGTIEVLVDRDGRTISIYRFDAEHRASAAAMESWDHVDLLDVLNRQAGVPLTEASRIAAQVREQHMSLGSLAQRLEAPKRERGWSTLENAGIPLRFVAVLLDLVLVFFPLGIVVGLLMGGGYAERSDSYARAGVNLGGTGIWFLLALAVGYHTLCVKQRPAQHSVSESSGSASSVKTASTSRSARLSSATCSVSSTRCSSTSSGSCSRCCRRAVSASATAPPTRSSSVARALTMRRNPRDPSPHLRDQPEARIYYGLVIHAR